MIIITLNGDEYTLSENNYLNEEDHFFRHTIKLDFMLSNVLWTELVGYTFRDPFLVGMQTVKNQLENIRLSIGDYIENTKWDFEADPINWDLIKEEANYNIINSKTFKDTYKIHSMIESLLLKKEIDIESALNNLAEFEKENVIFPNPITIEITGRMILR